MTYSRMAALGVAVSGLALVAGQGAAQPLVNAPTVSPLTPQPARIEAIHASTISCESQGVVFTPNGGYGGSADVFDGPMALILKGTKLEDVTGIAVVLDNGTRLAPVSRTECPGADGVSLRVVFNLPTVARTGSRAQLEVMAKEPPKLVAKLPPGAVPQKTCVDRLTGQPTGCPELPAPTPAGPPQIRIANVLLMLSPRPNLVSVTPDSVPREGREVCTARLVFRGSKLTSLKIAPDQSAINASLVLTEVSRTDTTMTADSSKRCTSGIVSSTILGLMTVRRGAIARPQDLHRCDTCADGPRLGVSFGGVSLTHGRG
jgi:hypothetical protein